MSNTPPVIYPIGIENDLAPTVIARNGQPVQTFIAGASPSSGVTIGLYPNIAALEAAVVTGLSESQPAIVESNGSLWSLAIGAGLTADGITVVNSPTSGTQWQRTGTVMAAQALAQTHWYVDPAAGNDEATGADVEHPIATKAEVARRLGTYSPVWNHNVTFTWLSSDPSGDPGGTDPWVMTPTITEKAIVFLTAALPAATMTATLGTVTAKNRATNQALESTFNASVGAPQVGMMLVNATRGNSTAFLQGISAGSTWFVSQPIAPITPGQSVVPPTEVDTWAAGDTVHGYVLVSVDVAVLGGVVSESDANGLTAGIEVYNLTLLDPQATGAVLQASSSVSPFVHNCDVGRSVSVTGGFQPVAANFVGCGLEEGAFVSSNSAVGCGIYACYITGSLDAPQGCIVDSDTMLMSISAMGNGAVGNAYIAAEQVFDVQGEVGLTCLYGPGGIDVFAGTVLIEDTQTWVGSLPLAGGILLNNETTAYSVATTGGVGAIHRLNLTAANLDAAAGAAGFGGLAFVPGVGGYSKGVNP